MSSGFFMGLPYLCNMHKNRAIKFLWGRHIKNSARLGSKRAANAPANKNINLNFGMCLISIWKMEQKKEWNQKSKRILVSIDNVAVFIELVRVSEFQFYVAFFTMESSIFESRPKTWESNFNPLTLAAFRAHCINSTDMFFTHGLFSFFHFEFWDERGHSPLSFEI